MKDNFFHGLPSGQLAVCYGTSQFFRGTLWFFNIAMENGPSMDDLPIVTY